MSKREQCAAALLGMLHDAKRPLENSEAVEVRDLLARFRFLAGRRRATTGLTALWSELKDRSRFTVVEAGEYADVHYVVAAAGDPAADASNSDAWREWLWPGPGVSPTDIVYDCTDEVLHGKAKPILCDLSRLPVRVFAIVPTQVEQLTLSATQTVASNQAVEAEIALRDAGGHVLRGPLPFQIALDAGETRRTFGEHRVTHERGVTRLTIPWRPAATPRAGRLIVRSQLNGLTAELPVEWGTNPADRQGEPTLTSRGLTTRWDPHPWLA